MVPDQYLKYAIFPNPPFFSLHTTFNTLFCFTVKWTKKQLNIRFLFTELLSYHPKKDSDFLREWRWPVCQGAADRPLIFCCCCHFHYHCHCHHYCCCLLPVRLQKAKMGKVFLFKAKARLKEHLDRIFDHYLCLILLFIEPDVNVFCGSFLIVETKSDFICCFRTFFASCVLH